MSQSSSSSPNARRMTSFEMDSHEPNRTSNGRSPSTPPPPPPPPPPQQMNNDTPPPPQHMPFHHRGVPPVAAAAEAVVAPVRGGGVNRRPSLRAATMSGHLSVLRSTVLRDSHATTLDSSQRSNNSNSSSRGRGRPSQATTGSDGLWNKRHWNQRPWSLVKQSDSDDDDEANTFVSDTNHHHHHHGSNTNNLHDDMHRTVAASTTTTKKATEWDTDTPAMTWRRIRHQFRLVGRLARPYFCESVASRWLLVRVIGVTLCTNALTVVFSYVMKDFWNALAAQHETEFYRVVRRFAAIMIVAAPVFTLYTYYMEQFAIHWSEWMMTRTFALYGTNQVYYKMELHHPPPPVPSASNDDGDASIKVDNPDQRITEDVNLFTSLSIKLATMMVRSVIDLISFSVVLWSIQPSLYFCAIVYATLGTIATLGLGQKLIRLQFQQSRRDADLRYSLVRLRDNAESIAFYRGADASESRLIQTRIARSMNNRRHVNVALRNLGFFTQTYWFLTEILPIVVVAPRYFAGEIEMGVINQGVGAFARVLSNLSIIIDSFEDLSSFSVCIERLARFYEAMHNVKGTNEDPSSSHRSLLHIGERAMAPVTTQRGVLDPDNSLLGTIDSFPPVSSLHNRDNDNASTLEENSCSHSGSQSEIDLQQWNSANLSPILQIHNLFLTTPDRRLALINDLNVELEAGQHLLIVGSSGVGKSSLLRAIAGLWTAGKGVIRRPADDYVYFLPQRPYCTIGSLKDQLLYPCTDFNDGGSLDASSGRDGNMGGMDSVSRHTSRETKYSLTDAELLQILEQISLLDVATRVGDGNPSRGLYHVMDWTNTLSLGEQQRLAFGRLLVNQPEVILLDEATSALDLESEARMYGLLQEMSLAASKNHHRFVTYISVGHRPSLLAFHKRKLRLGGQANHEVSAIDTTAPVATASHTF